MAANGISTLANKELKQRAKLDLAAANRAAVGNPRDTYNISQLPAPYVGNDPVPNEHPEGLIEGRVWITPE